MAQDGPLPQSRGFFEGRLKEGSRHPQVVLQVGGEVAGRSGGLSDAASCC